MVLVKKKPVSHHRKHHMHHRVSKEYANVYFPYLPVILLLLGAISFGLLSPRGMQNQVLGKAVDVSSVALLESTNNEREKNGMESLRYNNALSEAASAKARDMITRDYWSHNTPDGSTPWTFIDRTTYAYQKAGENLAFGFRDSQSTVTAWMNSPGHRANILDASFQEVGFGFADSEDFTSNGPTTIVVAMYGRPLQNVAFADNSATRAPTSLVASEKLDHSARASTVANILWGDHLLLTVSGLVLITLLAGIWVGSHLRQVRRIVEQGEQLILHHPILDIAVLSGVLLIVVFNQTVGFIK